jgi:hypothetical protein
MKRFVYAACAAFVVCALGFAQNPPGPPGAGGQTTVPFHELVETFATNEARAELLFQDKQITVSGTLVRVIKNRHGGYEEGKDAYHVELLAKGPESALLSDVHVKFLFNKTEQAPLADLWAGQKVVIRGHCDRPSLRGGWLEDTKEYLEVSVRDCTILKSK